MSRPIAVVGAVVAALLITMAPAPVGATTFDQLASLTFSGPVQVPGVTLIAGTYRFRLADPGSSRNVIQVLNHDGSAVYAMFMTLPAYRAKVTEDAVVTFRETPAGVPPAVQALFYGGESRGYAFVYPSAGPIMQRTERPQPEVTYARMPSAVEPLAPPVTAPAYVPPIAPAPVPYEAAVAPVAAAESAQAALPRTATRVPAVAVSGFASIVLGLGVGLLRRHAS